MTDTAVLSPYVAELRRQAAVLLAAGYPALLGLSESAFTDLVAPLEERVGETPFVLVVPGVPPRKAVEATTLSGRAGFTTMDDDDLARWRPTADVVVPDAAAYVVEDVDTGRDTLGVRPDDALPALLAQGRSPLTLAEGLAVVTQHPEWLAERNCFELLGSRRGDKRVTGLWLSEKRPRLGWCWGGNPHTWLGMATCARRTA